jgi:hypothetical protein
MAEIYVPISIQRTILSLSNDCCEYCRYPASFSPTSFHFDHIIPVSKGGKSILANLARACGGCNGFKQNKTQYFDPITHQLCQLYHPREDKWEDCFQWSDDDLSIIGINPTGRATVELLQMNRQANVNLRELLKTVGLHPPKY